MFSIHLHVCVHLCIHINQSSLEHRSWFHSCISVCAIWSNRYQERLIQTHAAIETLYMTVWTECSVIAGQTMVWTIFHLLPINLKFQWAILSKFNIAISVGNAPFFCWMAHGPTPAITLEWDQLCINVWNSTCIRIICTHNGQCTKEA